MSYEICPCCGAKKPVSPNIARDKEIRRLYSQGIRITQMVGKFFVGPQRLKQIIGQENLRPEDTNQPSVVGRELRKAKIMDLHGQGHSYRFIGAQVGLSGTRVSYIVRRQERIEHHLAAKAKASAGHQAQDSKEKNEESQQVTR